MEKSLVSASAPRPRASAEQRGPWRRAARRSSRTSARASRAARTRAASTCPRRRRAGAPPRTCAPRGGRRTATSASGATMSTIRRGGASRCGAGGRCRTCAARGRRELTARPAVARSSPPRGWRRSACARHGGSPTKRSSSKRSAAGQRAGAPRALPPPTRPAPAALALSQCAAVGPFCCADPSRGACCRGYLTSVILGTAPESPCAYPPGWRRSTGLKVTGSARDPVDEAAVKLAFLGFPWQYAYYGAPPPCASTLRHAGACSEPFRGL